MDDKRNFAGETAKRRQCGAESTLSQAAIFAFNAYSLPSTWNTGQWNFSKHFHPLPRGPSNDECTSSTKKSWPFHTSLNHGRACLRQGPWWCYPLASAHQPDNQSRGCSFAQLAICNVVPEGILQYVQQNPWWNESRCCLRSSFLKVYMLLYIYTYPTYIINIPV